MNIKAIRSRINKRRADLREKKLKERRAWFNKLSDEKRDKLAALGLDPDKPEQVTRRECGSIKAKE